VLQSFGEQPLGTSWNRPTIPRLCIRVTVLTERHCM